MNHITKQKSLYQISLNVKKKYLDVLKKTHLIFHTETYSVFFKTNIRSLGSIIFATRNFKYALSSSIENTSISSNKLYGFIGEFSGLFVI